MTAVAGGGQNPTGTASSAQSLAGAQTGATLDTAYTAHTEWWKQYWLESYVDLNDDVLERFYYGHQYLLGSSIRAGKMAPGLYGIWATTDSPGTISGYDTRPIHPGDNTINLEFVHPGEVLGINSPAAERQIGINTVNAMNSWGQDNSFPKIFTQAARVGYPAQSLIDQLKGQINQKTVANLRIYDPFHGLEKAGAIEAVNNMLLQSSGGVVRLFPVWPSSRDASFVNLREKGALLVSSRLQAGRVTYVDITTQVNSTVRLKSPWPGQTITVTRVGSGTVSHTDSGGIISFTGLASATYTINAP